MFVMGDGYFNNVRSEVKLTDEYNKQELKDRAKEILLKVNKKIAGHFKLHIGSEIKNEGELDEFIECYNTQNNETLRIKKKC